MDDPVWSILQKHIDFWLKHICLWIHFIICVINALGVCMEHSKEDLKPESALDT